MKNNLSGLSDHLFAQLERLGDKSLGQDDLEREIARTDAIVAVSEQLVNNAKIALDAAELIAKHGVGNWEEMLPVEKGRKLTAVPDYSKERIK